MLVHLVSHADFAVEDFTIGLLLSLEVHINEGRDSIFLPGDELSTGHLLLLVESSEHSEVFHGYAELGYSSIDRKSSSPSSSIESLQILRIKQQRLLASFDSD